MALPEDVARRLAEFARPAADPDTANGLLDCLVKASALGSKDSMEPLTVFEAMGGVTALVKAMKANTPVADAWPTDMRPACDLANIHMEASSALCNLTAAALSGKCQSIAEALLQAEIVPLLGCAVEAFGTRPNVLHRVLPALAQCASLMPQQVEASHAIEIVVATMLQADVKDVWIQVTGARVLSTLLQQRAETVKLALLHANALGAVMRALDGAGPDEAIVPKQFNFDGKALRQKLVAMGAPLLQQLGALVKERYAPGRKGTLQGLGKRADLNGKDVELVKPLPEELVGLREKGRVKVKAPGGELLSVQYKNVEIAAA